MDKKELKLKQDYHKTLEKEKKAERKFLSLRERKRQIAIKLNVYQLERVAV